MAQTTSLVASFRDATGATQTFTWSNVDPEAPTSAIKAFVNGVVSNSAALLKVSLVSAIEATLRTTTTTAVNLQ